MRVFLGIVVPALLFIAVGSLLFLYFVYPSLTMLSARIELGQIDEKYPPGKKVPIPRRFFLGIFVTLSKYDVTGSPLSGVRAHSHLHRVNGKTE